MIQVVNRFQQELDQRKSIDAGVSKKYRKIMQSSWKLKNASLLPKDSSTSEVSQKKKSVLQFDIPLEGDFLDSYHDSSIDKVHLFSCLSKEHVMLGLGQSRTQSPQAFWPAGERQERRWGIRKKIIFLIGCSVAASIVLPQKSCGKKFQYPRVSPGDHPLTKKSEYSGYEIGSG